MNWDIFFASSNVLNTLRILHPGSPPSGNPVTFAAARSPCFQLDGLLAGLYDEMGGNPFIIGDKKKEVLMLLHKAGDVFCSSLGHLDDPALSPASRQVLDPHHHLVSVNRIFDEAGGDKYVFPPSFSGVTNPFPLRVQQRAPTSRFISSGMPNLLFFSLTSEPSLAISRRNALTSFLRSFHESTRLFRSSIERGRSAFLNALRRSFLLKAGGRRSFFIFSAKIHLLCGKSNSNRRDRSKLPKAPKTCVPAVLHASIPVFGAPDAPKRRIGRVPGRLILAAFSSYLVLIFLGASLLTMPAIGRNT